MLVQLGTARNERIDLNLACTLAGIAGALNASAFYSVGFFAANMTGNVSVLSDHFAIGQWSSSLFYLTIVIAFIVGRWCFDAANQCRTAAKHSWHLCLQHSH